MSAASRFRPRVARVLRVAGAALLAAAVLGLGPAGVAPAVQAAQAVTCSKPRVQESTKSARAVFTGAVTASTRGEGTDGLSGAIFTQDVDVDRVYKGNIYTQTVQVRTDRGPQICGLGELVVGSTYVFFTQADGDIWSASGDGGTAISSDQLVAQVQRLLGEGRSPTPAAEEKAAFTPLDPDDPATVTRAAAPGLALIIVGLLGLVVVRRFNRR